MQIQRITIEGYDNIKSLAKICLSNMGSQYRSVSDDTIVIGSETYRLRTTSSQWEMVVLKKLDNSVRIDVIGTGGGAGVFNISLGSEKSFVNQMMGALRDVCDRNGLKYTEASGDLSNDGERTKL
ncbi:MAG: hypothetical protein Crog4KO_09960 [Crocinitomicaceae bacterium]